MKAHFRLQLALCALVMTAGVVRGQSTSDPFTHSSKNLILSSGVAFPNDKYLSLSVTSGLNANYQLLLPNGAPSLGQSLQVSAVSGTDYTLQWVTNTIGTGTATQVAFWSGTNTLSGNNNLWWDNTNFRLGIGTNAPAQPLHVLGNVLIDTLNAAAGQWQFFNPAGTFKTTFAAAAGQGADIPYVLPAAQGAAATVLTNDGTGKLTWLPVGAGSYWGLTGNTGTNPPTNYLGTTDAQPLVIKTNNTEAARITTAGYLGIGTTTPLAPLHTVISDAATTTVSVAQIVGHNLSSGTAAAGFGSGLKFQLKSTTTNDRDAAQISGLWVDATDATRSGALAFSTVNQGGALTERARINNAGNLGLNTTTPNVMVDINGGYATRGTTINVVGGTANNNVAVGNTSFGKIAFSSGSGAFVITGFADGYDGKRLRLLNRTNQQMTVMDQSASSSAANRIITGAGADVSFKGPMQMLDFIYDGTAQRWMLGNLNGPTIGAVSSILYAQKPADESVTNSAALQADDDLFYPLPAGQTWELNGEIIADCLQNNTDMAIGFSMPTGSTFKIWFTGIAAAGGNAIVGNDVITASTAVGGTGTLVKIINAKSTLISFRGIISTGANSGQVQFLWCQNVADPVPANKTIVRSGSYMKIIRIL